MGLFKDVFGLLNRKPEASAPADPSLLPNEPVRPNTEVGMRATPENQWKYVTREQMFWVDPDLRQAILDLRDMDRCDGMVKKIHTKVARDTIKGGLDMLQATANPTLAKHWESFGRRLQLNNAQKLRSDARGLVMEGNLPLQVVLDSSLNVVSLVRMPSETIVPVVDVNGRFKDVRKAYIQFDLNRGAEGAAFPLWKLHLARLDPDNFDDMGSMGRPYLDASRVRWRKLVMTEEDLVIRRRTRAPLRISHILEGAKAEELDDYRKKYEMDQDQIKTDLYSNKKGAHTALQGDENLDHVKDITLLLDAFFAGSPTPKGLMGFTDGLARDILEDLTRDYNEDLDGFQNVLALCYESVFRLELLLKGINPDADDFSIAFSERSTETPNQVADRGLKWQALGVSPDMIWEEMGLDPVYVRQRIDWAKTQTDPYPAPATGAPGAGGKVKITPGNARKGESGTSIKNR